MLISVALPVNALERIVLPSAEALGEVVIMERTATFAYVVISRSGGGNFLIGLYDLGCGAIDRIALDRAHPNFDEMFAAILSAKIRGDLVNMVADDCSETGGTITASIPLISRVSVAD